MFGSNPLDLPKGRNNHKDVGTPRLFTGCEHQQPQDSSRGYERPSVDGGKPDLGALRGQTIASRFLRKKRISKNPDFNVKSNTFRCWQLNQHTIHATAPLWVSTLQCWPSCFLLSQMEERGNERLGSMLILERQVSF